MRYIFLCFIFFTTTCLGQKKGKGHSAKAKPDSTNQVQLDTVKEVKPDTAKAVTYLSTESQTSKKIYISDTTFFAVHITGTGYETILMGSEKSFATDKDLDDFITLNKPIISTKKIFIITSPQTPYETIKPLLEILKEHQFFDFKIVAE
ncbi:MAG TPA: hypothetical protein VK705_08305 [Ferruginibacter sp.]|jgi:hypothetical protein|nr:hypothetical protein [Ferruginibacter sp.]